MTDNLKARLWMGIGTSSIVLCLPVGIYGALQGAKLYRSFKIGDFETVEKCKRNIKVSWAIIAIGYALVILLGITGVLD